MATFAYTGRTRRERPSAASGQPNDGAAVAALRREQMLVTRITPAKAKNAASTAKAPRSASTVPAKNLAVFTRQFSVMIDAGLPLVQCLDILGNQEEDKNFARVILQTRSDVEGGTSLADAMRRHPKAFDALFTNMIAAGEAGGILDTILKRLAIYIEKNVKLKGQVKSAMIYPVAVIVIAAVVVASFCGRSSRPSPALFAGLGAELPLPDARRHRGEQRAGPLHAAGHRRHRRRRLRLAAVLRDRRGPARHRRHGAEGAGPRDDHAQDRRRPLLPDAVDADELGRADPRRPRHHRPDRRQRHHRGCHPGDAQEHRARRDDRRRRSRRPRCSRRW